LKYQKSDYAEKEPLAPDVRKDRLTQITFGINKMFTGWLAMDVNYQFTSSDSTFTLYQYEREVTTVSMSVMF
jgi:hypothetical protein